MDIVIVEDEPLIKQRLIRLIRELLPDKIRSLRHFDTLDEADIYLSEHQVDILFLDLNLFGQNGFELIKQRLAEAFHTIVISAHQEKAIEAFELGVLDFIPKPFSKERLEKALTRLLDNRQRSHYGCRYLSVKKHDGISLIAVADISYIQAEGHYSYIHFYNSQHKELHHKNIERLSALLPEHFCRTHRSYIVNINHVDMLSSSGRYHIRLKNGAELPVGRNRYQEIKKHLNY